MREWAKNPGCPARRKVGKEVKDSGSWTTPSILSSAMTFRTGSNWKPGIDSLLSPLQVCSKMDVVCVRFIRKGSWDWCLSTGKGRKQGWLSCDAVSVELPDNSVGCSEAWMSLQNCPMLRKGGWGFIWPPLISHQMWATPGEEVPVFSDSSWSEWTAGLDASRALRSQRRTLCAWRGSTLQPTTPGGCLAQRELSVNAWWMNEPNQSLGTDIQGTNYIVTFTMWFRGSKKWLVH